MDLSNVKRMEHTFTTHGEAELALDLEATMATLTADPLYELVTVGWEVRGRDAVREMYRRLFAGYNTRVVSSTARIFAVAPNALCREGFTVLKTDTDPVTYHSIAVVPFDGDLISGERLYADVPNAGLMRTALGSDFGDVPGVTALI